MLVLSRKKNESIIINDEITVTVIEVRGDKVRLGIEAPKDVSVHRREIYDAIHGANKTAPPGTGTGTGTGTGLEPDSTSYTPDAGVT